MSASKALKVQIIIGSTRQGRFSEKPARYIFDELKKREGVEAELVDLRDWPLPFYDQPGSPMHFQGKCPHEIVNRWGAKIQEGDAYIIISPEYNHGYTAVLKNALDWLYHEWKGKPVGFVGYGNMGGARAIEQLRQVVIELFMHPIRNGIHIPGDIYMSMMALQAPVDPALFKALREGRMGDRLETFFAELIGLAEKLRRE